MDVDRLKRLTGEAGPDLSEHALDRRALRDYVIDAPMDALVSSAAAAAPDTLAIRIGGEHVTYRELDEAVEQAAAALADRLDGPGRTIGVTTALNPRFAVAFYATARSGNTVVMVNSLQPPPVLQHVLATARISLLFADARLLPKLTRLAVPDSLETIVTLADEEPVELSGVPAAWSTWSKFVADAPRSRATPGVDPDSAGCVHFTSGTTGQPKAVVLSHRNLTAGAAQVAIAHRLTQGAVILNHMPAFHVMHLNAVTTARATHVMCPDPDVTAGVALSNEVRAVRYYSIPMRLTQLAADPRLPGLRLETVQAILSGGTTLPPTAAARLASVFNVPVVQGYGSAESASMSHCDVLHRPKIGSVGLPAAGCEARLGDIETGGPVPQGAIGEVLVRGPQIYRGYFGGGAAADVDAAGWLHTGDVGRLDEDGYLFLTDRIKDVFKCDHELVSPSRLEHLALAHPDVAECVVVDVPDAVRGAVPFLVAVLKSGVAPERLTDVVAHVNAQTASYEQIAHAEAVASIPRSATGKVQRREVRDLVRERLGGKAAD